MFSVAFTIGIAFVYVLVVKTTEKRIRRRTTNIDK